MTTVATPRYRPAIPGLSCMPWCALSKGHLDREFAADDQRCRSREVSVSAHVAAKADKYGKAHRESIVVIGVEYKHLTGDRALTFNEDYSDRFQIDFVGHQMIELVHQLELLGMESAKCGEVDELGR